MGKQNKGKSEAVAVKAKRPMSAAKIAKRAANVAAYNARCAALKAGTFKGVVELAAEAKARSEAARAVETENARIAVVAEMSHAVYGQRLSRFIGNRPGVDPCRLLVIIRNWKMTQGYTVDHVRPTQG